jgi:hypothetical protein
MAANEAVIADAYDVPRAPDVNPLAARAPPPHLAIEQRAARGPPPLGGTAAGAAAAAVHARFAAGGGRRFEELASSKDWTENMEASEGKDLAANARDAWAGVALGTSEAGGKGGKVPSPSPEPPVAAKRNTSGSQTQFSTWKPPVASGNSLFFDARARLSSETWQQPPLRFRQPKPYFTKRLSI